MKKMFRTILFGEADWFSEIFGCAVLVLWSIPLVLWKDMLFTHVVLFDKIIYKPVMMLLYLYIMIVMKLLMDRYLEQRNLFWILVTGMTPAALLLSFRWFVKSSPVVILALAAVCFYAVVILVQMFKSGGKREQRARRRKVGMARILGCICLMSIVGGTFGSIGVAAVENQFSEIVSSGNTSQSLWAANKNYLRMWQSDRYEKLDERGKMELYQKLLDMECSYLGIEPVTVEKESYNSATRRGSYAEYGRVVSISDKLLTADRAEVLDTLLHECHHAYAHDLVNYVASDETIRKPELRLYQDVFLLKKGFEFYTESTDDYGAYYYNPVEVEARAYAKERAVEYLEYIDSLDTLS